MRKKMYFFFLAVFVISCNNTEIPSVKNNFIRVNEQHSELVVSKSLAKKVAISLNEWNKSRSPVSKEIDENIQTVCDDNGLPLIHIVNYKKNSGYILISGSQNYYPVIAEIDQGNFNWDTLPQAAKLWINGYKATIKHLYTLPSDSLFLYRQEWVKFKDSPKQLSSSRSISGELAAFIQESTYKWQQQDFLYSPISTNGLSLPQAVYNRIVSDAEFVAMRDDYMETSYIVKKTVITPAKVDLVIPTLWGQGRPYNIKIDCPEEVPTGCVATAMAQIMNHYKKPASFAWDKMKNSYFYFDDADEVAYLMKDIGQRAGINYSPDGSGTNNEKTKKAYNSYGYSDVSIVRHNEFTVKNELLAGRLVHMTGTDTGVNKGGHAWVCDGMDELHGRTAYYLMTIHYLEPLQWRETEVLFDHELAARKFHLNWGYNGDGDGWYTDCDIHFVTSNGNPLNFYDKRTDIINIH